MKILLINKFLYPNGGSETYTFQLGEYLEQHGHSVQYFGMEHPERCVGNAVNAYTSTMDFHTSSGLSKISYAFKTVYSVEARKKLRLVLDDFQPDVIHLNNFNYQLTPSMIVEVVKWEVSIQSTCKSWSKSLHSSKCHVENPEPPLESCKGDEKAVYLTHLSRKRWQTWRTRKENRTLRR